MSDAEERRVLDAIGLLSELPLYIDDTPIQGIVEMRGKARRLQTERGLDLVIVDYLQLLASSSRIENRAQEPISKYEPKAHGNCPAKHRQPLRAASGTRPTVLLPLHPVVRFKRQGREGGRGIGRGSGHVTGVSSWPGTARTGPCACCPSSWDGP